MDDSLSLLQMDAAHRARALDLASFIVEAPAGAGKTELLTQRYLKLLAVVSEPEEIVAITFTNKAAAEMRGRVLQSLQDAADAVPAVLAHKQVTRSLALQALARARELGWNLLEQPGRLRINTIDSFCSLLARQMPLMSRFGAQPAVSQDADVHYREAAQRTLAMLEGEHGSGPVTEALRYFDNDASRLTVLLAEMLATRDQWLHHVGRDATPNEAATGLRHLVQHDIVRAAAVLDGVLQRTLMPAARYAAGNLPCEHPVALLLDWETPLRPVAEALPMWRAVCDLLLTGQGELRKERGINVKNGYPASDEGRAQKALLLEVIAAIADPQPLARLRELPAVDAHAEEWRVVGHLVTLLQLGAAHLMAVFQEAGEVDFVEVASRALLALEDETGPTDLALRLDYRIQHLLVDEFQDTSPAQVELLRRLTQGWEPMDGRTLFCVGDPMQSIYRFRKADVGLFLQVAEFGIGHLQVERLHLTRNNRSCPAVVDWVNGAFAGVFPRHDSVTRGAISYRPFVATRAEQADEGVTIHPLVAAAGTGSELLAMLEAQHVADLIERERSAHPERSIAVLVRARSHLAPLVAELRRNRPHLKFQAVEVESLAGRQTVQDVLALTRALLHRGDRVHWLAVLRAPWCGLMLADLHALAADDHQATVWSLMQDEARLARLSDDGRARLLHVREVLAEAYAHQGRQPLRRWLESAWLKLGGAQCLWDAGDVRDVQAFFDLVESLDGGGGFDPDALDEAMAELYAAPDVQADAGLQFMTLHKSKGLEFDTVILPGLHRQPKSGDSALLLWEEVSIDAELPQLVAAPWVPRHLRDGLPSAYDYLRGLENERSANEAARVLYVGATRAVHRLHLVGAVSPNAKGEVVPPAASFLALLWSAVGAAFAAAVEAPLAGNVPPDTSGFIPQLIRVPAPAIPGMLSVRGTAMPEPLFDREAEPEGIGGLDADCGTLAHLYMEMIAVDGLESWPTTRVMTLQGAMGAWLQSKGHAEPDAEAGAARVAKALVRTLSSADGAWVLRSREQAASELAIATAEPGRIMTHVVDRTFVEQGIRWVVDYKSARLGAAVPEHALAQQAERYRPQLERYARLFADDGLPVRKAVFFLAYGKLVELGEN